MLITRVSQPNNAGCMLGQESVAVYYACAPQGIMLKRTEKPLSWHTCNCTEPRVAGCACNCCEQNRQVTVILLQVLVTGRNGVNAESQMEEMGYPGYSN